MLIKIFSKSGEKETSGKQRQIYRTNTIEDASQMFLQDCKEGPDDICFCCHHLTYGQTVVTFDHTKYENVLKSMMNMVGHSDQMCYPRENKHLMCKTCDQSF